MPMIPYGKQWISEEDKQAILDVLNSDFLTQGPKVTEFEESIANFCGAKYAISANSATSSLHLACLALELGAGDWLWTSPISFLASSNCALYCGANVDFVDICAKTYNMSVEKLEQKLIQAKKTNKLPKIVIPVHFAGQPCDMQEIYALSQEYGFSIIEDAAHAIGSSYKNHKAGNCQYSDIAVFSFHPVKVMTTGEGGIATTNSPELYRKMKLRSSHGVTRDAKHMHGVPDGPWYYQMIDLGFNYRMTDIQAALGVSQLKQLNNFIEKRNILAQNYFETLRDLPIILPFQKDHIVSAWHLFVICIDDTKTTITRSEVFNSMQKAGIGVNVHFIPIHLQPYYQQLGFQKGDFPVAEGYYQRCITLPIFYHLNDQDQTYIINTIKQIFA